MRRTRNVRLARHDFERAVATETSPNETPITFSNNGLYRHCIEHSDDQDVVNKFIFTFLVKDKPTAPDHTKPYKYRIRKSSLDFRTLFLVHPSSQWRIAEFYRDYSGQIVHFCTQSNFSIRSPGKLASTVFIPVTKQARATTNPRLQSSSDRFSFFAYRGYDRLYKFFNSKRFVDLESRFPILTKIDITKCFDSIYSHSIAWATRHKEYAKSNTRIRAFANDFDALMQKCNHNETNGIPIGPEVSRIFAEIIFQAIDASVESLALTEWEIASPADYVVARYVDDIFIFTTNAEDAKRIRELYIQELAGYNLHLNKAKTEVLERPFFTSKSKVIRDVNTCINSFIESFLVRSKDGPSLQALTIFKRDHLVRSFVDSIKAACIQNHVNYDEVVPYIVSALTRRSARLAASPKNVVRGEPDRYFDASVALLDASFFFYGVAPAVTSSYDLCTTIITLHNFAARNFPQDLASIKQLVHDGCLRLFEGSWGQMRSKIDGFVFLEAINVALATCTNGTDFMIPAAKLRAVLPPLSEADYFQLMAILFYCKEDNRYAELKIEAITEIDKRLRDLTRIRHDSHLAHIFLDAISCPHIAGSKRMKWVRRLYKVAHQSPPSRPVLTKFLDDSASRPWFTDWLETDLLAALGRKKLHQAYA